MLFLAHRDTFPRNNIVLGGAGGVSRDVKAKVLRMCQMREKKRFVARCPKDFCWRLKLKNPKKVAKLHNKVVLVL